MSNVDLESAKGASSNDDTRGKLSTMLKARIQDLKPFREELQCRKHSSKEKLAEKIPEVIFTGELVHGEGFQGTQLGVACSWHFVWDDPWTLLEVTYHNNCNSWIVRQGNFRGQTQLAASTDCNAPWNHPLDIHFAARSPLGWPKLVMQVQELDEVCNNTPEMLEPYSYTLARMFSRRGLWVLSSSSHTGLFRAYCLLLETDWFRARRDICIFPGKHIKTNKL
jgi:hypothetical protein|tara:strand:- start:83 stop:751 length:669 start_codon:yes stop_codon:yes gene_type:complete